MKTYKAYQIVMIVFVSIFLNIAGHQIASSLNLPLWLDSLGTFLTAYALGPICGMLVGAAGNCINSFFNPVYCIYALSSIFMAGIVGALSARGWMDSLLKTMSLSVLVTLVCVFISVVLNIAFFDGRIGNEWGNEINRLLEDLGILWGIRIVIGQFYVDFLDKVFTLCALFVLIRFYRFAKPKLPAAFKIHVAKSAVCFLFLIAALPAASKAFARSRDYNSYVRTLYNKENGILSGKANDIASTNDGVLWIGTYEGLYRYNGRELRLMNEFESVSAVRCLYVDDEGRLFVGTNDSGLSIIINESVTNMLNEEKGLPDDSVRSVTRCSDGFYYVGTSESLAVLSIADGLGVKKEIEEVQGAIRLSADDNDHIAAVTASGLLYILKGGQVLWSSPAGSERFTSVKFAEDGSLYASTESNYVKHYKISEETDSEGKSSFAISEFEKVFCPEIRHINSLCFYDGLLFLTSDTGVGYIEEGAFYPVETASFNNSIDNMVEDYQGNLWFTSSRLGVFKMCQSSFSDTYSSAGLSEAVVNSTARFKGDLYFASDNGLMAIDSKTGRELKNELTKALANVRIRCLLVCGDGSMWLCTKSLGLVHARAEGGLEYLGKGHQFRVARELSDGSIVAGAGDGVAFIQKGKITQWISEDDGLENPIVLSLSQAPDGTVLAGTDGGGLVLIRKSGREGDAENTDSSKWHISSILKRSNGLSSNIILRTVNDFDGEEETGNVFVITSNAICYMELSTDGGIITRTLTNFPFTNNYDMILYHDNNIFVLSSVGIFVVNRNDLLAGKKLDYELLDLKKGLRGSLTANSWNLLEENGDLYLSCDIGSSRLNLNTYSKAGNSYRMQLKSVIIDNKRHLVQKDIPFVIPADSGIVEIVPEIVNYSIYNPYVSLYFEGVDESPVIMLQSEISTISYTGIKPGTYRFHIAILDSKGRKNVEEAVYTIVKDFNLHDNWWFMLYTVGVAMLAVIWLTWFTTSSIQQRRMEKQQSEIDAVKRQVQMGNETIFAIANSVEARDKSTGRHSYRVAEYSAMIAQELGFSEEQQEEIRKTGLLHDIGKIGVPDNILNKTTKLTDEEYEIIKRHTIIGSEMLKGLTLISRFDEGAKYHHERYDGSGYPFGLKGEEIPLNARIIGIADAFDAMTANRIYRKRLDMEVVKKELRLWSGSQFDPGLVEIMLDLIESGRLNVYKTMEASTVTEEKDDKNEDKEKSDEQ